MKTDRRGAAAAKIEIAAVIATGLLHLASTALRVQGYFIVAAIAGWTAYIVYCVRNQRGILREWGFRADNFPAAFRDASLICIPAALALAALGAARGSLTFPARTLLALALYPFWGVVQQFLVQALVVRNLERLIAHAPRVAIALIGAALFGIVHTPDLRLMAATFCLGFVFVHLYRRHGNLWPLGLYHGWLGALFYLWALGREPWSDVMAQF